LRHGAVVARSDLAQGFAGHDGVIRDFHGDSVLLSRRPNVGRRRLIPGADLL
jgi:hypothetical protein